MDGRRFDDLAKTLGAGTSRRGVMRGLAGAMAAALGLAGSKRAEALTPRPAGATCIRNATCASGICNPVTRRCAALLGIGARCATGTECESGNCNAYDNDPESTICCPVGASGCNGICCPSGTSCEPGPACVD